MKSSRKKKTRDRKKELTRIKSDRLLAHVRSVVDEMSATDGYPWEVLRPEQRDELRRHLTSQVAGNDMYWTLAKIDAACARYQRGVALDDAGLYDYRPAIQCIKYLIETYDHPAIENMLPDLESLHESLEALERQQHVHDNARNSKRGPRPKARRDALVGELALVYKGGTGKRGRRTHFDQTVEIVLRILGEQRPIDHRTVSRALEKLRDRGEQEEKDGERATTIKHFLAD